MTESEDKKEDRIDRLLSIIEKQQEQVAKLTELVETTLARQRSYLDEDQDRPLIEHRGAVEAHERRPIRETRTGHAILRTAKYFRKTPSAPPIIAFMFLLIGAATQLAIGNQGFAERLAEISYYMLATGVVIQLAETVIESRRKKIGKVPSQSEPLTT